MLKKSNILALVGGGILPKFSENKITIWDDHQGIVMSQIRLNSNIIKVKIREDAIIGALIDKIYIININTLETIDVLETLNNPHGILSISYNINDLYIAFPNSKYKGKVEIDNYVISKNIYNKAEPKLIQAHESNIAYITINNEGTLLATSSDKGTLIRLFNILKAEKIIELRRGAKNAIINCLAFDINSEFIGCTSDSFTVHIFDIHEINKLLEQNEEKTQSNTNNDNKKEKVKNVKPVKINERSFAKYKVQDEKSFLGFCQKNTIIILTPDGKYQKATFDVKSGGNCKKIEENFIKTEND
jgi:WD40 repeat protein